MNVNFVRHDENGRVTAMGHMHIDHVEAAVSSGERLTKLPAPLLHHHREYRICPQTKRCLHDPAGTTK